MVSINSTFARKIIYKTPKYYKRNTINGDIHHSRRVSSNFDKNIFPIKEKFMKDNYTLCFIYSATNKFQKGKEYKREVLYFHEICLELQNLSYLLK